MRGVDIGFGASGRGMSEDALYDKDIDFSIIEMRSQGMPKGMAGHVKSDINGRGIKKLFEVIFHSSDRQTVSLF